MTEFQYDDEFLRNNRQRLLDKFNEVNIALTGYMPLIDAYYELKKENSELITRETLQNNIKTIMGGQNLLVSNFYQILGKAIQNRISEANFRTFGILNDLAPIIKFPIPAAIQNVAMSIEVLDFITVANPKYIIILQGSSPEVFQFFENCRTKDVCIIYIILQNEKLDDLFLTEYSESIRNEFHDYIERLYDASDYLFPSLLPPFKLKHIPNNEQLHQMITALSTWVKKPIKKPTDLIPKKTIPVEKTGGMISDGQISERMAYVKRNVEPDKEGRIIFRFVTSEKQCSPYRLHIYLNGEEKALTDWFGYSGNGIMSTGILTIENISDGRHELKLQPEGKQEGCNQGFIAAWEGELQFY